MTASTATHQAADIDRLCIDTIRTLSMDAVQAANSGHPGTPMALAPIAYLLYTRVMDHNPRDPAWPDRDRFVLSAGHASMLLYSCLHLSGYDLGLDDLKQFRKWGSRTPGHPEHGDTPGVETTTGPLGQGFANGVGLALAERFLRERYGSEVIDHNVYAICSDGDLMEGIASESASLAGQLGLGKLVYFYDDNTITIDGHTDLAFDVEDVSARFAAYGWHVQTVEDVNDLDALSAAIETARGEDARPSLIHVHSIIGWPAPDAQNTSAAHGSPLGDEEIRKTKEALGWDPDLTFHVPDEVYEAFSQVERGRAAQAGWKERFAAWRETDAERAAEWDAAWAGRPTGPLGPALPAFDPADKDKLATRAACGEVLAAISELVPTMVGGCADLTENVKATFKGDPPYSRGRASRNIHFGVREHAMGGVVNGLAVHGGIVRPYSGTFMQFSDYMRPALRLAALMGVKTAFVFSHDSLGLGEDGPTHQPVEHLASLRAIPNMTVIRPADAAETGEAWRTIIEDVDGPACLILSRQGLPVLARGGESGCATADGLARGAYVLAEAGGAGGGAPDVVLVGTGSEVAVALEARERLGSEGIAARVVSMPSWELFAAQDDDYRASVLPPGSPKVSVEAGVAQGWEHWVDRTVSVERFGASAPGAEVLDRLGINAAAVIAAARDLLSAAAG